MVIGANPQIFMQAYANNSDPISVHTYTHPYMSECGISSSVSCRAN